MSSAPVIAKYYAGFVPATASALLEDNRFITLRFASPADIPVAYLETRAGSLYVEKDVEVRQYTSLFQHLCARRR